MSRPPPQPHNTRRRAIATLAVVGTLLAGATIAGLPARAESGVERADGTPTCLKDGSRCPLYDCLKHRTRSPECDILDFFPGDGGDRKPCPTCLPDTSQIEQTVRDLLSDDDDGGGQTDAHGECVLEGALCAATAALAFNTCIEATVTGEAKGALLILVPWDGAVDAEAETCLTIGVGAAGAFGYRVPAEMDLLARGWTKSEGTQWNHRSCENAPARWNVCGPISATKTSSVSECAEGEAWASSYLLSKYRNLHGATSHSKAMSSACDGSSSGSSSSSGAADLPAPDGNGTIKLAYGKTYKGPIGHLPETLRSRVLENVTDAFWSSYLGSLVDLSDEPRELQRLRLALGDAIADRLRNYQGNATLSVNER